jgi:hypothetical protein
VHTISNAAVASGALSLAESYVLTREAFEDYLDHLTPDGTIFFTRPEFQIPRLVSTVREVFARRGLGSIENHVIAFSEPGQMQAPGRSAFTAGFLLKKNPFTAAELQQIRAILKKDVGERGPGLKALYFPDERPADSLSAQIVGAAQLEDMIRTNDVELQAATDDKPFFNQHTRWSRIRWSTIVDLFSQKGPMAARLALEDRPIAEVTLLILLVQSAIVAGLFILLPLIVMDRRGLQMDGHWGWLAYFAALGLGFIMVEIALLQRFLLFLGQPIYTYAVVLAGLLIFSGIGSSAAGKWKMEIERAVSAGTAHGDAAVVRARVLGVGREWILHGHRHGAGAHAGHDDRVSNRATAGVRVLPERVPGAVMGGGEEGGGRRVADSLAPKPHSLWLLCVLRGVVSVLRSKKLNRRGRRGFAE